MMTKIKIYLGLVFLLIGTLLCGGVSAQLALPSGGGSFETAVLLGSGSYRGSMAEEEITFYRAQANAGQEIKIETDSNDVWVTLINDKKEELQFGGSDGFVYWLPNSEKSVHSLYLKISNEAFAPIESYNLKISLTNRYDANSQTDAGDTFEKALNITTGEYQGYLAGTYPAMTPKGDDFKDYYKIPVKKGITYTFKVTPPSADEISLELFNLNRESIDEKSSANSGGIVSLSLAPIADTDIFILVAHDGPISGEVLNYKLEVKSSGAVTKFYNCKATSCELAGDFLSLGDCQIATTKTCYRTTNCDGKCATPPPPVQCAKDSDCPAGNICQNSKCEPVVIPPSGCTKNSDCPTDSACVSGQCVGVGPKPPVPVCQNECSSGQTKCFDNFNYYKCGDYNKDGCFEWASPVYCGEGNKCAGGACVKAEGCQCSEWQGAVCGASGCAQNQAAKVRVCAPAACDVEKSCQDDSSCQIIPPPPSPEPNWFGFLKGFGIAGLVFGGLYLIFWLLFYIYLAICLQVLAKKTGTGNGWMAWIPIANIFLMLQIAQKPLWWFLLLLIPLVNIVIAVILWMAIAERRGKENWIGILIIVPVVGIAIPGYLAFSGNSKSGKIEPTAPYAPTGTLAADKPTVGYKHACKYCDKLIPPNSSVCPLCKKTNPLGPYRCPKCHEPIEKDWQICSNCGQNLRIVCPFCQKVTFFGDHCQGCEARLLVTCPHCGQEQPPLGDKCIKCDKSMEKEEK